MNPGTIDDLFSEVEAIVRAGPTKLFYENTSSRFETATIVAGKNNRVRLIRNSGAARAYFLHTVVRSKNYSHVYAENGVISHGDDRIKEIFEIAAKNSTMQQERDVSTKRPYSLQ
jgi:hypothetical protein